MASNREEKLQMRQRGAASRKVKEVDFGFSFGLGPLGAETEAPSHPSSQPTAAVAEPPTLQPSSSAPQNTQRPPPLPPSNGLSPSPSQSAEQRPRSARSTRRQRPSTFDIPSEEEPEQRRTSKRRKIESPREVQDTSTEQDGKQVETNSLQPFRNGENTNATKSDFGDTAEHPPENENQREEKSGEGIPDATIAPDHVAPEQREPGDQQLEVNGGNENGSAVHDAPQLGRSESTNGRRSRSTPETDDRPSPKNATTNGKRKRPTSRDNNHPSEQPTVPPGDTNGKRTRSGSQGGHVSPENDATAAVNEVEVHEQSRLEDLPQGTSLRDNSEAQESNPQRGKRRRGRPSKSLRTEPDKGTEPEEDQSLSEDAVPAQTAMVGETESSQPADIPQATYERGEAQVSEQQQKKRPRGRPSTSARAAPAKNAEGDERRATSADSASAQPPKRGRRGKNTEDNGRPSEVSTANGELNEGLNAKMNETHDEPNGAANHENTRTPQQQKQPKKTKSQKRARRQPGRGHEIPQNVPDEPQPEKEPELEHQQEPTPAETPAESSRVGGQRGRPKKGDRTTIVPEDQQRPHEDAEETTRPTRKKARSRGETVPVTVHRLANIASLMGDGILSADEESADELSTDRAIKLPNRGGVNPADVLSQVCRETLEKTLTTLKNGVSNETNPARRSEYVRKTKAVEGYSTELEGRLLELSETHDNNYMLGVQAKRAKKEVMDLRGRLYRIRKERQEVAAQMDAVRKKHAEDLDTRVTRSTINNSLHSLELALDRSQNRPTSEGGRNSESSVTDGLEFMLRTVADGVSSTAPGARGGLLNTIKAFNGQLETTAEELGC